MNPKIQEAINGQINQEFYSAYLYLSMAAYFDNLDLSGFSNWMKVQAQEEMNHGMKFYNFVNERGGTVALTAIAAPPTSFDSPLHVVQETEKHEKAVTVLINKLYELAKEEKDYAFESLLKWYIDEQVEEENNTKILIDKLKLAGSEGPGLFILNKELGERKLDAEG